MKFFSLSLLLLSAVGLQAGPQYVVINVGADTDPISLSNSGYVLEYPLSRWHAGTLETYSGTLSGSETLNIDDAGDVLIGTTNSLGNAQSAVIWEASGGTTLLNMTPVGPDPSNALVYNDTYPWITALDLNGTIYDDQEEIGSDAYLEEGFWSIYYAPEASASSLDFSISTGTCYGVFFAKDGHTAGYNNTAYTDQLAVDENPVSFQPTDINTSGDAIGYDPNTGAPFIYVGEVTSSLSAAVPDASNVWGLNSALRLEHSTGTWVDCPQFVGVDQDNNPILFQNDPDTGVYDVWYFNDLISSQANWSGFSTAGGGYGNTIINDSGVILGAAIYTPSGSSDPTPAGPYSVLLVPAYQIQVDAFIPQQWVSDPFGYVYNGNSRKTPLDGSFTTGTSTFTKSGQYKMEQTIMAFVYQELDPTGVQEQNSLSTTMGPTKKYYAAAVPGGTSTTTNTLSPTATPFATQTAIPSIATATVTHTASRVVTVELVGQATDPLANPGAPELETPDPAPPLSYDITVKIDATTTPPTYTLTGNHKLFPAYEVYINGQLVHDYSPIPGGDTPYALLDSAASLSDSSITGGTTKPLTGPITNTP
jgi:hypothetical protein